MTNKSYRAEFDRAWFVLYRWSGKWVGMGSREDNRQWRRLFGPIWVTNLSKDYGTSAVLVHLPRRWVAYVMWFKRRPGWTRP